MQTQHTGAVATLVRAGHLESEAVELIRAARNLARARRINAEKHDRRVMLKIKLKDLAAEARSIKREEQKRHGGWLRAELRDHRVGIVRSEARATHLAYGFLRDRARGEMERETIGSAYVELRKRVRALVAKYGRPGKGDVPDAWFEEIRA